MFSECFGRLLNPIYLPLVSREWKNGSNSSYNCTPFLHSLLTKGKFRVLGLACTAAFGRSCSDWRLRDGGIWGMSDFGGSQTPNKRPEVT